MKTKMIAFLVAFAAAFGVQAATETVNGYTWSYGDYFEDDDAPLQGVCIYGISPEPVGHVTIPSILGGRPVTHIEGDLSWEGDKLTGVTIPSSVVAIGRYAFEFCTSLKDVVIPESVSYVGAYAFNDCFGLESIKYPPGAVVHYPEEGDERGDPYEMDFSGYAKLRNATLPNGVRYVSFSGCSNLVSVVFPESLVAFVGKSGDLDYVASTYYLPGELAFAGCDKFKKAVFYGKPPTGLIYWYENELWTDYYGRSDGMPGFRSLCMYAGSIYYTQKYAKEWKKILQEVGYSRVHGVIGEYEVDIGVLPCRDETTGEEVLCGEAMGGGVYAVGKNVSLKAAAKKGFVFAGWYYSATGESPVDVNARAARSTNGTWPAELIPCDSTVVDYRSPSYTYVMGEEDATFYARFEPVAADTNLNLTVDGVAVSPADEPLKSFTVGTATNMLLAVGSLSLPKITVKGLPTGMKFTAKGIYKKGSKTEIETPANSIYGTPTKPGLYTVTVKLTNVTMKKGVEKKFTIEVPNLTGANDYFVEDLDNGVGAKRVLSVGVSNIGDILPELTLKSGTLAVKGLPSGLKYDKKTGKITGVATKAGTYTVYLTVMTADREKLVSTFTIEVQPLPAWAVGTFGGMIGRFEGPVENDDFRALGTVNVTVGANGKISAKVIAEGNTTSFSAAGYGSAGNGAYRMDLEAKNGDRLTLVVSEVEGICVMGEGVYASVAQDAEYAAFVWRNEHGAKNRLANDKKAAGAVAAVAAEPKVFLACGENGTFERVESAKEADLTLQIDARKGTVKYSGTVGGVRVSGSDFLKFDDDEGDYYYLIADLVVYDRKSGNVVYLAMGWDVAVEGDGSYSVSEDFEWFIYPFGE